jgi:hypothetical protein
MDPTVSLPDPYGEVINNDDGGGGGGDKSDISNHPLISSE